MKSVSRWFLLLSLLGAAVPISLRQPAPTVLAIIHVTVIDVTGAGEEAAPDQTVIIKSDRISSIGKTGEVPIPKGATTVDATGKFLIPGLWDMHVHTLQEGRPEIFFPLFIASGVTGVRDMGSPLGDFKGITSLRERIGGGKLLGPRIIAAGPIVDGPSPMFPELSIAVAGETEARQVVNDLKSVGADFIKVYSLLNRDAYFAVADEAKRRDIPFAGHVPESVSAAEASNAGQRSIEHLSGVRLACSTSETELRTELLEARATSDASLLYRALRHVYTKSTETYNEEKAEALFARFVENETWQVPTLVVARFLAKLNKSTNPAQTAAEASLKLTSDRENDPRLKGLTTDDLAPLSESAQNASDLVGAMRRAGVKFMAGTDAPNPFVIPGRSLHDELALLVQAGFTPMEALQSATRNPAIYLGKLDTLGTIEEGKVADLVLLDANPLGDITNTRKIWAVIIGGKIVPKTWLEEVSPN
ncbi:MAG: amidohydrolase family protein [Blastocatellia bacterium]